MPRKQSQQTNTLSDPSQWVDLYGNFLFRFALSRLRKPDLAENAVQETLLAAIRNRQSFSGHSLERTWLTGILKHKIIDYFRHQHREIAVTDLQPDDQEVIDSFFDHLEHPLEYPGNWSANPKEIFEKKEFWTVLEKCLERLPLKTAQAFSMREIDGLTTDEICKELGVTSTNLWVMLHRARLQLRSCLEQNWFGK